MEDIRFIRRDTKTKVNLVYFEAVRYLFVLALAHKLIKLMSVLKSSGSKTEVFWLPRSVKALSCQSK